MKIVDVELIRFRLPTRSHPTRWGYSVPGEVYDGVQSITRVTTDDGAVGYASGGVHSYFYAATADEIEQLVKPLLVGEDPLQRERFQTAEP